MRVEIGVGGRSEMWSALLLLVRVRGLKRWTLRWLPRPPAPSTLRHFWRFVPAVLGVSRSSSFVLLYARPGVVAGVVSAAGVGWWPGQVNVKVNGASGGPAQRAPDNGSRTRAAVRIGGGWFRSGCSLRQAGVARPGFCREGRRLVKFAAMLDNA